MKARALLVLGLLALAGCGANPLSVLTGGGPNVAANTQAGKTNAQTLGSSEVVNQKTRPVARGNTVGNLVQNANQSNDSNKVRCERVERVEIVEKDSPWLIWALVLSVAAGTAGLIAPQPGFVRRWGRREGAA